MRVSPLLALIACLIPALLALVAQVPNVERNEYGTLVARETAPETTATSTTTTDTEKSSADVPVTRTTGAATVIGNSTSTSTSTTATSSVTTIPTINTSEPSNEDGANSTAPGALPLEPVVTPALGIGGFILIATGSILAVIGIRNLWVQVFLSSAFLTSLGVTVLIVYVMSPPVRVAIQGAYLVAIFFTGITFGALSIVFKELTEGLGYTNARTGFIGAISVGFYAISFSHYTRPYGLIASTAIAGGTAVALGIDCFSKAGLKEFWLYIWALNDNIFPLDTNTYPVTRNIRVELAATVIVALMGVVSQLRLWKVVRERRAKEEERRQEEQKLKDEAEAEAGKRLEENNLKERMEWEAKYGDSGSSSSSPTSVPEAPDLPELPDSSKKCAADEAGAKEKGEGIDMESITDSESSYRCSECRANEANDDAASDATGETEGDENEHGVTEGKTKAYRKVFDGAVVARIADDKCSEVTATVGSETGSVYSKRLSRTLSKKVLAGRSSKPISESQEALITNDDDAFSMQGIVDEISDMESDCRTIAAESHHQAMVNTAQAPKHEEDNMIDENPVKPEARMESELAERDIGDSQLETSANPEVSIPQNGINGSSEMEQPTDKNASNERKKSNDEAREERAAPVEPSSQNCEPEKNNETQVSRDDSQPATRVPKKKADTDAESETQVEIVVRDTSPPQEKESVPAGNHKKEQATEDDVATPLDVTKEPETKEESVECLQADAGSALNTLEDSGNPPEPRRSKKLEKASGEQKFAGSEPEPVPVPVPKPKKQEPARLNAETVQQIPKQTSRVVQSYRTNEWAKHLADAEVPELEPIAAVEQEEAENPVENEEVAAPVKVTELLQTPLNAQPPPAIEPRISSARDANDGRRVPNNSRTESQKKKRTSRSPNRLSGVSVGSGHNLPQYPSPAAQVQPDSLANMFSATLLSPVGPAELVREESETVKPRWKGPPPLIAVREDMMRNRLSSFSLVADPYARSSPGQSPTDLLPRYPSNFPTLEAAADDVPLSQRRTMLHHQATTSSSPVANIPSVPPPWRSQGGTPSRANSPAALAAWRESVREDLREKRNPLKLSNTTIGTTGDGDRGASPFGQLQQQQQQQQQRNVSSVSIGDKIAEGMQRGDMSDLHREAMRRMQAKANQSANQQFIFIASRPNIVIVHITASLSPLPPLPPPPPSPRLSSSSSSFSPPKTAHSTIDPDRPLLSPPQVEKPAASQFPPRVTFQSPLPFPTLPPVNALEAETGPGSEPETHIAPATPRGSTRESRQLRPSHHTCHHPPSVTNLRRKSSARFAPGRYPLLTIPEQRRSRLTPSPDSLVVERSQQESESGRSSIAVPPGQRHGGAFDQEQQQQQYLDMETTAAADRQQGPGVDRPRHVPSQHSLRSQSQIASIPSNTGAPGGPEQHDVAEELAWGPAHPCFPHINPHVPPGSDEYLTTRIIRIRRDWMIKGDLAPTFSNLYPEILDPLLPEQEFRRIIATVNEELISAFDPFSFRNWLDGALALITGWIWEDLGAPGVKSHLKRVEDWVEKWNREVGAKDGVRVWSLRSTAYMSLDIQIPDPKVGIIPSEGNPSLPGTRPGSGV
ncbi:hypothetical protein ARAM_006581 [Aspergillus rambellii]|uniref:Uncharacterized protein n=1 Tax=Aspergillus rambellii TaxID=308745 RepID=A0A0F8WWS1_9EURO|nr:hypothetical protein ARAM_006581 [Aspergillus rambellii]